MAGLLAILSSCLLVALMSTIWGNNLAFCYKLDDDVDDDKDSVRLAAVEVGQRHVNKLDTPLDVDLQTGVALAPDKRQYVGLEHGGNPWTSPPYYSRLRNPKWQDTYTKPSYYSRLRNPKWQDTYTKRRGGRKHFKAARRGGRIPFKAARSWGQRGRVSRTYPKKSGSWGQRGHVHGKHISTGHGHHGRRRGRRTEGGYRNKRRHPHHGFRRTKDKDHLPVYYKSGIPDPPVYYKSAKREVVYPAFKTPGIIHPGYVAARRPSFRRVEGIPSTGWRATPSHYL